MAKLKSLKVEGNTIALSGTADEITEMLEKAAQKPVLIRNAVIKDGLCNYGYEINQGAGKGDLIPNRKGSNIVHSDMEDAFSALAVHLACIDDAFKYAGIHPETSLEELAQTELAGLFRATGFKLSGKEENDGFVIYGEKSVTTGYISLESPKINLGSNYPYFEELKEAVGNAILEVEAYMNGKHAPKAEQGSLEFPEAGEGDEFNKPIE